MKISIRTIDLIHSITGFPVLLNLIDEVGADGIYRPRPEPDFLRK
ncbi:MAG: hypothetical protein R2824_05005 [Saprospiraceae bacterium]